METLLVSTGAEAPALPACSQSAQGRRNLQPQEIVSLLTDCCETIDEELELIEMRYQQALALMNLQDLFAEDRLD